MLRSSLGGSGGGGLDGHSVDGGVSLEPSWEVLADLSLHRNSEEAGREAQDFSEKAVARRRFRANVLLRLPGLTHRVLPRSEGEVTPATSKSPPLKTGRQLMLCALRVGRRSHRVGFRSSTGPYPGPRNQATGKSASASAHTVR